jgi:hypothetical protein
MTAIEPCLMVKGVPQNAGLTLTGAAQKLVGGTLATRCIEVVNIGSASDWPVLRDGDAGHRQRRHDHGGRGRDLALVRGLPAATPIST